VPAYQYRDGSGVEEHPARESSAATRRDRPQKNMQQAHVVPHEVANFAADRRREKKLLVEAEAFLALGRDHLRVPGRIPYQIDIGL